jgi:hypothetical protein
MKQTRSAPLKREKHVNSGVPKLWPFAVSPDTAVVTTTHVTRGGRPILFVTHEHTEEDGTIWQFHSGNGDYSTDVLQLVSLREILKLDASIYALAQLPIGFRAVRSSGTDPWVTEMGPT